MLTFTAAVLAGGRSSRMGVDKARLLFEGRLLIQHMVSRLAEWTDDVLVVAAQAQAYDDVGIACAVDRLPNAGPLGGLYTAVCEARRPHVLAVGVDMPFIQWPLAEHLLTLAPNMDAVVPRTAGRLEPLCAVYAVTCRPAIRAAIRNGWLDMAAFHGDVRVRYVDDAELDAFDPGRLSLINLNTPEDIIEAVRLGRAITQGL